MRAFYLYLLSLTTIVCFSQNWPVTPNINSAQDHVQMIGNDSGDAVYISFEDTRGNNSIDIFVQKMDLNGNPLWIAGGIAACDTSAPQETQKIITDGADGCIVVWSDRRVGSGQWDIYVQRFDPSGNKLWGNQGKPVCTATGEQRLPEITSDKLGGAYIVWEDKRGSNWDVYVQRIDPNGDPYPLWPTDGLILSQANSNKKDLAIDEDGSNGAFIAWTDNGSTWDIYCTRVLPNATIAPGFPVDGLLICDNSNTQDQTVLAYTGNGHCIVAWKDQSYTGGAYAVYANRVRGNGTIPSSWDSNGIYIAAEYQSGLNRQGQYPEIIADGCGGAIITGESTYNGTDNDVFCQKVDSNGMLQWTSNWPGHVQISYSGNNDRNVKIAPDGDGGFFAAWRMTESGTGENIKLKWFDKNGSQRNFWNVCNESNNQDIPAIVSIRNCAYVAWEDNRPGSSGTDIFGQDTCHTCFLANTIETITDETCTPGNDGEIDLQVFVLTKNYELVWADGDTSHFLDSLSAGWYHATVTDGYGCEYPDSFYVSGPVVGGFPGVFIWNGNYSTDWFEPCNWDKISLPDTSDGVVIPGATAYQPLIANDTAKCDNIVINSSNGGHLTIDVSNNGILIKNP